MIGVISDIHGNYPALYSVLTKLDELGCEKILVLGDVVGYYCMHNECIEELRKRDVIHLMGNHDYYLVNNVRCDRSSVVNECINWQRKNISQENFKWLKSSLMFWDDDIISARHAGWNDFIEEYVEDFDFTSVKKCNQKYFISGHTHVQTIKLDKEKVYFNPGSVGQPRDGDSNAAFAVLDENVKLLRISYDIDEIVKRMNKEGFSSRITKGLYSGKKIGSSD